LLLLFRQGWEANLNFGTGMGAKLGEGNGATKLLEGMVGWLDGYRSRHFSLSKNRIALFYH